MALKKGRGLAKNLATFSLAFAGFPRLTPNSNEEAQDKPDLEPLHSKGLRSAQSLLTMPSFESGVLQWGRDGKKAFPYGTAIDHHDSGLKSGGFPFRQEFSGCEPRPGGSVRSFRIQLRRPPRGFPNENEGE